MDGGIGEAALASALAGGSEAAAASAPMMAAAIPASEAVGISGASLGAGAMAPDLGGLLGASEAAGISGAPYGAGVGALPPSSPSFLAQMQSMLKPGGPVGNAFSMYGKANTLMNAAGMGQHPMPSAAPVARPQGQPAPLYSASQVLGGGQRPGMPGGGSAGMVGNAMGGMGAGGGMSPELMQLLMMLKQGGTQ